MSKEQIEEVEKLDEWSVKKEKKFEDLTKKQKEMLKEIVLARLKRLPNNIRLSIG